MQAHTYRIQSDVSTDSNSIYRYSPTPLQQTHGGEKLCQSTKSSAPGLFISPLFPSWLLCSWGVKLLHVLAWPGLSLHARHCACSCILTQGTTPAGSPLLTLFHYFSSPHFFFAPPSFHMPNHLYFSLIASLALALSAAKRLYGFQNGSICMLCAILAMYCLFLEKTWLTLTHDWISDSYVTETNGKQFWELKTCYTYNCP